MTGAAGLALEGATHAHHWLIGEPNGPFSSGRCKRCGETRDFRNWLESLEPATDWDAGRQGHKSG